MKFRRHHNNKGFRQIQNGKTREFAKKLRKKFKIKNFNMTKIPINPKIYQVGGSVRDMIRGVPSNDIDYVVVGATPQWMIENGYKQVGADFPVFLNEDGVEFALARTERKVGSGYHGFVTEYDPNVTLEDDLRRRDLTINAIAYDIEIKEYIDPFGGIEDIKHKRLKHVSEAFREDPVRVLRLARFKAQFGPEWQIDQSTIDLCKQIAESGELDNLTKERVWKEFEKALSGDIVSFFTTLRDCDANYRVFWLDGNKIVWEIENNANFNIHMDAYDKFALLMITIYSKSKLDCIDYFCEVYHIPNEYRDYAKFRKKIYDFTETNIFTYRSIVEFFDGITKYNNWRNKFRWSLSDVFTPFTDNLLNYYDCFGYIGFADLTEDQKNSLKGKQIRQAIIDRKVEELQKARIS